MKMKTRLWIKNKSLIHLILLLILTLLFTQTAMSFFWAKNGDPTSAESSVLSILSPIILSVHIKDEIKESRPETRRYRQAEKERHEIRRRKLQANIPDMVVKQINYDESNGKWQMRLEDPNNPENHAILTQHFWPKNRPDRDTDSIVNLQEGDKVVFGEGSLLSRGWLLYDDSGKKIGYAVPDDVQLDNYSEQF